MQYKINNAFQAWRLYYIQAIYINSNYMRKEDTYINLIKTIDKVNPDKVLQHPQYMLFLKFFRSWAGELQSCFERIREITLCT